MSADAHRAPSCVFCGVPSRNVISSNDLAFAIRDISPATPLHSLVLPKRHAPTYLDLQHAERAAIDELLMSVRLEILRQDPTVAGFNIGINAGETAGQTIFHCHVHLIPRRVGDVANPRGGVRAVIPGKASTEHL